MITPRTPSPPKPASPRGWSFLGPAGSTPTVVTPSPSRAGEVLGGRYELIQQVGKGGMGVVYVARDRQLPRRPVAVKILPSRDAVLEQRFLDEIEILDAVSHPNLVQPLGKGRTAAGQLYLAMEYIRGENLSQRLAEFGPLAWREAVAVGIQAGEVLAALHAAGVLHRDIKPSNIMLCSGVEIEIKVIDLGVAKKQPERWPDAAAPAERFHTDAGVAVGTPRYQPPEAGHVPADPRLDVFGLAATIYELCTGECPERECYRPLHPDAPQELDDVLAAALAFDPLARTASIEVLVAGLRQVRDKSDPAPLFDDRYEFLRPLGSGGKCEVVLAHHRKARRDVALKLLQAQRDTPAERERLRREARVLGLLRHPAFPALYDFHEHDGRPYLAMELVTGQRASRFVDAPLSPAHVIEVGIQLAEALLALRELGVVHRDIHTSNVMIDFECAPKTRPVVRLLDLGMCELLPEFYARIYRYGTPPEHRVVLGTGGQEQYDWTAPEARRERKWSEKSDVWSVGLLLFQLLTGHRPFRPRSEDPPESPRKWVPGCSSDLADALLAALNPDPRHRLDAAELLERLTDARAIQAIEDHEGDDEAAAVPAPLRLSTVPAPAAAPAPPVTTPPPAPGPAPAAASSQAGSSSIPELAAVSTPPDVGARPDTSRDQPPTGRRRTGIVVGLAVVAVAAAMIIILRSAPSSPAPERGAEDIAQTTIASRPNEPELEARPSERPGPTPSATTAAETVRRADTELPAVLPARIKSTPRPTTARTERPATFAAVMQRLEPQVRACAQKTGFADAPVKVQVRYAADVIDAVRVLRVSEEHPFSTCVDSLVRQAQPPATLPLEEFTFMRAPGSAAG